MTQLQSGIGMRGGPENPIGARGLYLWQGNKDTLYRIHGTNEPWTIGQNVSSGCIRLTNDDITTQYFAKLKSLLRPAGRLVIVDFKAVFRATARPSGIGSPRRGLRKSSRPLATRSWTRFSSCRGNTAQSSRIGSSIFVLVYAGSYRCVARICAFPPP